MNNGKLALGLSLALAAIPTSAMAERTTATFSSITVFGDSLVDAGNISTLTGGATPNPAVGYFDGRFTNGFNYPDLLSIDLFGVPTVASLRGGTNFAYGGARATTTSGVPDFQEQLALYTNYLSTPGQVVDPNGLFILNFGGNDIFAAQQAGAPTGFVSDAAFLQQAAAIYAGGVQTLNNLGARNILITGFPVASQPGLTFSLQGEMLLMSELGNLSLAPSTTLYRFSYLDFFGRLLADPTSLGLPGPLTLTTTCRAANAQPDCAGIFSFDGTHPTAAVQRALYNDLNRQFSLSAAVPEPDTWAMMLIGFGLVGGAMRSSKRRKKVTVSYA